MAKIVIARSRPFVSFQFRYVIIRESSEFDDRFINEVKRRLGAKEW